MYARLYTPTVVVESRFRSLDAMEANGHGYAKSSTHHGTGRIGFVQVMQIVTSKKPQGLHGIQISGPERVKVEVTRVRL